MPDTSAVTMKVIVLFFAMLCGLLARKIKILDEKSTTALSGLLVNITNPLLMVYSFQKEYTNELLKSGLIVLAISVAIHLAVTMLSVFIFRPIHGIIRRKTYMFATIYCNCGFLGYPVLMALFESMGDGNGLFYGAFFTLFFNMYVWTYGVYLMNDGRGMSKKEMMKKIFLNPGIIATLVGFALFLIPITLPKVVFDSFVLVGDATFPLSMFITGSLISQVKLRKLADGALWYYCFVKLLLLPTITLFVCKFAGLPTMYTYIAVVMTAMPGASNTAIFADIYKKDTEVASKAVGVSTFVSIFTIPLILYLINVFI